MADATESCEVVVLGGGVAGLFAARALRGRDVVVLEADDRAGGRVLSARRGDYWVNLGAQFAEGHGPLIEAVNELDVPRGSLAGTSAAFAWNDKIISSHNPAAFVLQARMSLRGRIDLARLGLRLQKAYKRLAENPDKADARAYRDWLDDRPASVMADQVRTDEVRRIFTGWVRHWVGCEPDEMAAGQFVLYMGSAMLKAAEVPEFSLPVGGNEEIIKALVASLGPVIRLGSSVTSVSWDGSGVTVQYDDATGSRTITAKQAVVATQADTAARVLTNLDDARRDSLAAIKYGRYMLAGVFTSETGAQPWDDLYAIATPGLSFQVIYNHAAALRRNGPRKPGGALVCYAGGILADELFDRPDEEIKALFARDLARLYPVLGSSIDEMILYRRYQTVPYWQPGGRQGMRLLREPIGPIHLAGDYLGYPSMTAAAMAGDAAGRAAVSALG
jgi:monoamine oxidase